MCERVIVCGCVSEIRKHVRVWGIWSNGRDAESFGPVNGADSAVACTCVTHKSNASSESTPKCNGNMRAYVVYEPDVAT